MTNMCQTNSQASSQGDNMAGDTTPIHFTV